MCKMQCVIHAVVIYVVVPVETHMLFLEYFTSTGSLDKCMVVQNSISLGNRKQHMPNIVSHSRSCKINMQ